METLSRKSTFELFLLGSSEDVVDAFFKRWPPDLILRLRCVSSSVYLAVEAYIIRAWSIHDTLSPWFFDPQKFLRTLDECDGIVSGSTALLFLGRDAFVPSDLDIYVPLHGVLTMGRYLKAESFRYQPTRGMHPLFDVAAISLSSAVEKYRSRSLRRRGFATSPIATFNFYRPGSGLPVQGREGTHVQVSVTCQDPVMFIIESFHSSECPLGPLYRSIVLNIICSRRDELHYSIVCRLTISIYNIPPAAIPRLSRHQTEHLDPSWLDGEVSVPRLRNHHCRESVSRHLRDKVLGS